MIWYFKNKESYLYPFNQKYSSDFINYTYRKHYENEQEDSIIPSLTYMYNNNISNAACVVPIEDLSVNYGIQQDINEEFCITNHIPTFYIERTGGAIVLFPGNIAVDIIYPITSWSYISNFLKDFQLFLIQKGIITEIDKNDLLVDGKKIVGVTGGSLSIKEKQFIYFGIAISINSDIDLINSICTKPMVKEPGALSDYNITTEEVIKWVLQWLDKIPIEV